MRKPLALLCALFLFFGVAACGADGDDTTSSGDEPTTAAPANTADSGETTTTGDETTTTGDETTTTGDETANTADEPTTTEETTTEGGSTPASGTAAEYTDALVKGFTSGDPSTGDLSIASDDAECVAPKWIDTIGVDTLQQKGTEPADLEDSNYSFSDLGLSEDQASTMIDAFGSCDVDLYSLLIEAIGADLDDTQKSCLENELSPELAKDLLVAGLQGDTPPEDLQREITAVDEKCNLSAGGD